MLYKMLLVVISIILLLILIAGLYLFYAFLVYKRKKDNLKIDITNPKTDKVIQNEEYTIMSWNIGFGAYSQSYTFLSDKGNYSKEENLKNMEGIYDTIEKYNPDFLLNQEVDIKGARSYNINDVEILTNKRNTTYTFAENYNSNYYIFYPIYMPLGNTQSGLLTQSKYNIKEAFRKSIPVEKGCMKFIDLDRAYSINKIVVNNEKELVIFNVHLSSYTEDSKIPKKQLEKISEDLRREKEKGNYVICAGDYNKDLTSDNPETYSTNNKKATWNQKIDKSIIPDGFSLINMANKIPSCRNTKTKYEKGKTYAITIDGFIVSDNIEIIQAEIIDTEFMYSDHNPAYLKFKLK